MTNHNIIILLFFVFYIQCFEIHGQGQISRPTGNHNASANTSGSTIINDPRLLSDYSNIRIGDWMTGDGRYSHEKIDGIPYVGVVFSLNPSEKDRANGWSHGYIVALEDAKHGKCTWGPKSDVKGIPNRDYPDTHELLKDMDGYYYSNLSDIKASTNNAFSAARSYPKRLSQKFSGWYLPSVGQWMEILRNLGKVTIKERLVNQSNGYTDALFDVSTALSNMKKYGFKESDYSCYWTANECIKVEGYKQDAWIVWLTNNYNSDMSYLYTLVKVTSRMGVRSVAAF